MPNAAVETCRVMPGTTQLHFCSSLLGAYAGTNALVNLSSSIRLPGRVSALGRSLREQVLLYGLCPFPPSPGVLHVHRAGEGRTVGTGQMLRAAGSKLAL